MPEGALLLEGTVSDTLYQGPVRRIDLATPIGRLVAAAPATAASPRAGDSLRIAIPQTALHAMEPR